MTLREIYQALGEGKAIRHETWPSHRRISIGLNLLTYETGELYEDRFLSPMNWSIYEEPPHRSEEPEDLDKQIVRTEVIAADFLRYQPGFAVAHISNLIDLKIKQAKL